MTPHIHARNLWGNLNGLTLDVKGCFSALCEASHKADYVQFSIM